MSLLALQQDFRAWLHLGDMPSMVRFPLETHAGLAVYQNNFRGRIIACLDESFAVTRAWLGDGAFRAAIVEHVAQAPPSSWSLDHYPDAFPPTLARLYPGDPEVAEIARLELALGTAFVAADAVPVAASELANVDWDRAQIYLCPFLKLLPLTTNAPAIWSAITARTTPPPVEMLSNGSELLVWRKGEAPHFRTADDAEARALHHVANGLDFGSLCAWLVDAGGQDPALAAGRLLAQWISDGLIVAIGEKHDA